MPQGKAVIIKDGKMEVLDLKGQNTYDVISKGVGGMIERFAVIEAGPNRTVDFWCNDEFMLNGDLPNVAVIYPYPNIICGGVVIMAANERTGDSVGLTDEEVAKIRLIQAEGEPIPSLIYEGYERPAPPQPAPEGFFIIDVGAPWTDEEMREMLKRKGEQNPE